MENEIKFLKEMKEKKVPRRKMAELFMEKFFPDMPCNIDYFNECWTKAHAFIDT